MQLVLLTHVCLFRSCDVSVTKIIKDELSLNI